MSVETPERVRFGHLQVLQARRRELRAAIERGNNPAAVEELQAVERALSELLDG
jgi:hypothetical protein